MLAESLLHRLPGCPSVCEAIMRNAVNGLIEDEEEEEKERGQRRGGHVLLRPSASLPHLDQRLAVASALCAAACGPAAAGATQQRRDDGGVAARLDEADALASLGPDSCPASSAAASAEERQIQQQQHSRRRRERYSQLLRRLFEPHWPAEGLREWVYTSFKNPAAMDADEGLSPDSLRASACCSRMYVQHGEGELRTALTILTTDQSESL